MKPTKAKKRHVPTPSEVEQVDAALRRLMQSSKDDNDNDSRPTPIIEFLSPSQIGGFEPPPGMILAGDCHLVRGAVSVIGGPPGIGKSRAATALAFAGAMQQGWFGLPVHCQFRTMIVQNENGPFRLKKEFANFECEELDDWIRVCPPPPLGLCFSNPIFADSIARAIHDFKPGAVIIDPWNAAAPDDKAREYLDTFNDIRTTLPKGKDAPALVIVAHTRKPKADDRASGRGLLNLLAGSYVLGSVPRSVFIMQAASDAPEDDKIIFSCVKNNDGAMGPRSAWRRHNGLFTHLPHFDWDSLEQHSSNRRSVIDEEDMEKLFDYGQKRLKRAEAVKMLGTQTDAGRAACYEALKLEGRFGKRLSEQHGLLSWASKSGAARSYKGDEF